MTRLAAFLGLTFLFAGCVEDEDVVTMDEFRAWTPSADFWNWNPQLPANGDMAIHSGEDVAAEDCIIWDITGSDVHEGSAAPNVPPLLQVVDNGIFDPQGILECYATEEAGLYKLRDGATGEIVMTSWGRYLFDTDISVMPPVGSSEYYSLRWNHLAIELLHDRGYAEMAWKGQLLGTSTDYLHNGNPMRKLLYGALFLGECGSNGPW